MFIIRLNKSHKPQRKVISIFLMLFTLPQAVNAASDLGLEGVGAYLSYAIILILILTFILAFINYRNILYERKLLEEERSELAKQRLRLDEDFWKEKNDLNQQKESLEKELNEINKKLDEDGKLLQKTMAIIENIEKKLK